MRIPPGFNTVTPYLFVEGADRFIEFLAQGLGGIESGRHMNGERIGNAQVLIGTSTVMVIEASIGFLAMPASYYLFVENADESMIKAIAAGGTEIMAVTGHAIQGQTRWYQRSIRKLVVASQRLIDGPY